jgi:iron complex outermembrane receptor protein
MLRNKLAFLATTALVGNAFAAATAAAQSTASSAVDAAEVVVVTGSVGPADVGGVMQAETVAKNRTTIDADYINKQQPGQTIIQTLSVVTPGLNFTNNDPYGSSGGNLRLHGFDGNRVALTFDGMPLNDSGNYATFTNQLLDGELISKAQVNTGSTDVDSPTAASTGGTINFQSINPDDQFGVWGQAALGEFAYRRYMVFAESGEVGPWGTSAWIAGSYQKNDKFKGDGEIYKRQFNAKIYQPLGEGNDFISVAFHYNVNRNNNIYSPSLQSLNANGTPNQLEEVYTDPKGWDVDFRNIYLPDTVTTRAGFTGDIDVAENTNNGATRGWYGLRINPSNTGNVRVQSRFDFGDNITLTIDPSFQYVLANGGTQNTTIWEACNGSAAATSPANGAGNCPVLTRQLLGTLAPSATNGVDINGDGDINDLVRVMNPSNTNTRRFGVLTSLIYKLNPDNLFRVGYTLDYARHRQTGEFARVNNTTHFYEDEFGGKDGHGNKILTADGASFMRNRDRFSIAQLSQISGEYRGKFFDDSVSVSLGLRAPFFERELNQYFYSQDRSSNVRCTTETPNATLTNGNVTFTGATTQYIAPYKKTLKFDDVLPNVGASYFFGDHQLFVNYAESTSLPRTDNLYTAFRLADGSIGNPEVKPEESQTFESGYRYNNAGLIASASYWHTNFQNRIVSSFDQDLGIFIDRNVGEVEQWGIDSSIGWQPVDEVALYASYSYNTSDVAQDIQSSLTGFLPTRGKKIVETPDHTFSFRIEYEPIADGTMGWQTPDVGRRFVTDVNDLSVDPYAVSDFDLSWRLDGFGLEGSSVRLNVSNVFDKNYYGSIGSTNSATVGALGFSRPFANVGAPRSYTVSLRAAY